MKKACLFLNGEAPSRQLLDAVVKDDMMLVCADGAANYLRALDIEPHIILGDFDSILPETMAFFAKNFEERVVLQKIEDQESTDFEKALQYCLEKDVDEVVVLGGLGARPDHLLTNYSVLRRYYEKMEIRLMDEELEVSFIKDEMVFPYKIGEVVSLMPLPKAIGITMEGLKYPLNDEDLEFGVREGTLNSAIAPQVSIRFKSGHLLLFKKHFIFQPL